MSNMKKPESATAFLYSLEAPTEKQRKGFEDFLARTYPDDTPALVWKKTAELKGGFRLEVGSDVYDWSLQSRMEQLRRKIVALDARQENLLPLMRQTVTDWTPSTKPEEIGTVLTVGDDIATISGLQDAVYGEVLEFTNGIRGMVQELRPDELCCVLFGDSSGIEAGDPVHRTGKVAGMPVGEAFLGRVVDALGNPIDGGEEIQADAYYPIERPAPGIIHRQPVNQPMETGLLAVDALFPIGRGQRELIIGDRQTGKTAVALDTILNQKGKNVVCIYVAIGQKASSVALLTENLRRRGAMDYCIVVNASASDSASLQYIAPYAGCSLGEYFMHQGRDVLIVYDDLSKHAIAYRALSLLLERSPGREAYPGDVFYLHSRLLERSAHLSDDLGGGSMTALPIIETQAGDVSAYIPTNVISITDGQIFLETELFHAGVMPAVNPGISVSRVGGDAQIKAMKQVAGSLKLLYSQYRELQSFAQFGSDLDQDTKDRLAQGERIVEVLKQKNGEPVEVAHQVCIFYAVTHGFLKDVAVADVHEFEVGLYEYMDANGAGVLQAIRDTGKLAPETEEELKKALTTYTQQFLKSK